MALFGNVSDDYTSTGKGGLTSFANKVSFIPLVGGLLAWPIGMVSTLVESAQWLFQGKILSAATSLTAGAVSNSVNAAGGLLWWGNVGSGIATGATIGTHARAATEGILGAVTGALGVKPTVLRSYPAAIGSIGSGGAPAQQRKFSDQIASQRGQNPDDAYARYMSGDGGVHVNELQSANGRGA
jgi:hypothetical protein